ncbi:MAG: histidine phosphatase family protein [Alloprevotella sp.]|nr:histidine phosphatase family protein [Alloprevotella sp.]
MDRNITLFLIRHGETEENRLRILQGHLPGTLTPEGVEAARATAEHLTNADARFDLLLCSDLLRARRTAIIIGERLHLAVRPTPLLRERDWGSITGRRIEEVIRTANEAPGVESVEAMFARARILLDVIRTDYPDAQRVLLVSHGLFLRVLQAAVRGTEIKAIPPMKNLEVRSLQLVSPLRDLPAADIEATDA